LGLAGSEKELQEGADALRPGCFVVLAAPDLFVMQIAAFLPAPLPQNIAHFPRVRSGVHTLLSAGVEPYARLRLQARAPRKIQNTELI
jgi:hypothetical protein